MQWLTAGEGIVHCEMFPLLDREQENPVELFQIWLNLPAADKMVEPYFTMLWDEDIPRLVATDGDGRTTEITVVAGRLAGLTPAAAPAELVGVASPSPTWPSGTCASEPGPRWDLPPAAGRRHHPHALRVRGLGAHR